MQVQLCLTNKYFFTKEQNKAAQVLNLEIPIWYNFRTCLPSNLPMWMSILKLTKVIPNARELLCSSLNAVKNWSAVNLVTFPIGVNSLEDCTVVYTSQSHPLADLIQLELRMQECLQECDNYSLITSAKGEFV